MERINVMVTGGAKTIHKTAKKEENCTSLDNAMEYILRRHLPIKEREFVRSLLDAPLQSEDNEIREMANVIDRKFMGVKL